MRDPAPVNGAGFCGKTDFMRVTKKWLSDWINEQLKDLPVAIKVKSIDRTFPTTNQIESGAFVLIITLIKENDQFFRIIGSTYLLKEMEWYLDQGYTLYLDTYEGSDRRKFDWTLEFKK